MIDVFTFSVGNNTASINDLYVIMHKMYLPFNL